MTGLQKILEQIKSDSEKNANSIISAAQIKAQQIIEQAEAKSQEECDLLFKKSEEEIELLNERIRSARELNKKQHILIKKQEIIVSVLNKAKEKILSLTDNEYFSFLKQILEKMPSGGVVYFNSKDSDRLNADITSYLSDKNLTISKDFVEISGGFIIKYGDIEENCSIDALFESENDRLTDQVSKLIFG